MNATEISSGTLTYNQLGPGANEGIFRMLFFVIFVSFCRSSGHPVSPRQDHPHYPVGQFHFVEIDDKPKRDSDQSLIHSSNAAQLQFAH